MFDQSETLYLRLLLVRKCARRLDQLNQLKYLKLPQKANPNDLRYVLGYAKLRAKANLNKIELVNEVNSHNFSTFRKRKRHDLLVRYGGCSIKAE